MNLSKFAFIGACLVAAPLSMAMQKNSAKLALPVLQSAYKNTYFVNNQSNSILHSKPALNYSTEIQKPKADSPFFKQSWIKKQTKAFKSQAIITAGFGAGLYIGYGYLKGYMPATAKHVTNTVNAGVDTLKAFITKEVKERIELLSKKFDEFRKENNEAHHKTHQDLDQIKKDLNEIKRRI